MKNFSLAKEILVVSVPEDANGFKIVSYPRAGNYLKQTDSGKLNGYDCKIPTGYQILSIAKEMTEELAKIIMPSVYLDAIEKYVYHNYPDKEDYLTLAIEAFYTFMNSIGMPCVNPYGDVPECGCMGPSDLGACPACDDFVEAEVKLVNTVILYK